MPYFAICEGCGRDDLYIIAGLCHECAHEAERAANGGKQMARVQTISMHEPGIRTTLAPREVKSDG